MSTFRLAFTAALTAATLTVLAIPARADDIVIGLNMVKSGALKDVGEATETSVDIAVEEINARGGIGGKKIKLVKYDTGSDPKQAATATQKFAEDDHALAVIGPFSSGEAAVGFPVGERLGIVEISNSSSQPGLTANYSYAWRFVSDEGKQFTRLLKTLKKKSIQAEKAAILYVSDERVSNISGTRFYPTILKANGIAFGNPIAFQYNTFDVSPQVSQALEQNPDIVALAGTPDSAGKVIKELRREGFAGRVIGSQIFADPNSISLFGRRWPFDRRRILVGSNRRDARLHKKIRRGKCETRPVVEDNPASHRCECLRYRLPAQASDGTGWRHGRTRQTCAGAHRDPRCLKDRTL
jgi:branched-chain amino acid transport system substrate-binding protein